MGRERDTTQANTVSAGNTHQDDGHAGVCSNA